MHSWQCLSSCPKWPQRKKKKGSLSYLKLTQNFSLSTFATFPLHLRGLYSWRSTLTLMNFAWSECPVLRSDSMKFPKLLSSSLPTSMDMCSKSRPQIWTQNGKWVKTMFKTDKPFLHLHNNNRLLSKFQGPFRSTQCNWYSELNLNYRMLFPTPTICKS